MEEQGWIYVLVNSSIPGLMKVGRTTRPPAARAVELSAATGVATPFVLAFEQPVADCVCAERLAHAELDRRGLRVAPNREFFRGSPAEIIRVVLDVAAGMLDAAAGAPSPPASGAPVLTAHALLAEGERHLFGTGAHFQDVADAAHYYRLAAAHGSLVALERLGAIYAQCGTKRRPDRRRAMRYLKDGARRGNYYCYCEMAMQFAREGHVANFHKAWAHFFAARAASFNAEAEAGEYRYPRALWHYVLACHDQRLCPGHLPALREAAPALIRVGEESARNVATIADRRRLAVAQRWVQQTLVTPPARKPIARAWIDWLHLPIPA